MNYFQHLLTLFQLVLYLLLEVGHIRSANATNGGLFESRTNLGTKLLLWLGAFLFFQPGEHT